MKQLNESYNCPCFKTCATGNPVMPNQYLVLDNAQAEACNLNQTDGQGNSIDTCCDSDSNMVGGNSVGIQKHTPTPRGPIGPLLTKGRLREIIRKSIIEIMNND